MPANSARRRPIATTRINGQTGLFSHHRCACLHTQRLLPPDLSHESRGIPDQLKTEAGRKIMGKLEGKIAVITGGSSGMALASAKRFVEEGAYVFITGRRQETLDEAVSLIGRNVTGVRGDASNLDDLDRLFDIVRRERARSTSCTQAPAGAKPSRWAKLPSSISIRSSA